MSEGNIFERDLDQTVANHQTQTPLSFLAWAASVYPDKAAVIHGDKSYTYAEFDTRCRRLASALKGRGIGLGDTVAVMAPNSPPMLEAHYGVPMIGAVLNALNFRLDGKSIAFILEHGEASVLITDRELSPTIKQALDEIEREIIVIDVDDPLVNSGELLGEKDYESFLDEGNSDFRWETPNDECNGWCFTWAVTAVGGTHVCLRSVDPGQIFPIIRDHGVTHMCGAPIVLNMLVHAPDDVKTAFPQTVEVATGGAAPPSAVIAGMERLGFNVTHLYGLTESYGPSTFCAWQTPWDSLDADRQAAEMARQGVRYPTLSEQPVMDPETMTEVPADGESMGELMLRGNTVMKGYLKNPEATEAVFSGGWFHTGDLGVLHPDGYVEIKDRSKDIIISGGENISSLEIEDVLYKHPEVMEAAVVAKPHEKWGEVPKAFVTLKPNQEASEDDIVEHCREKLAGFKVPKTIEFGDLPKTSTGKIQKFLLRNREWEEHGGRIN